MERCARLVVLAVSLLYCTNSYSYNNRGIMLDCGQLRSLVVRPTLEELGLWSQEAEDLLIGTAAVESRLGTYLKQIKGPALGIFQMEPATHDDIWDNYLAFKPWLRDRVIVTATSTLDEELVYNLRYATAMARVHYLRVPEPLPHRLSFPSDAQYIQALGAYWKEHYNTYLGKGSAEYFVKAYKECGCDK